LSLWPSNWLSFVCVSSPHKPLKIVSLFRIIEIPAATIASDGKDRKADDEAEKTAQKGTKMNAASMTMPIMGPESAS
jgi:hypothetical protein